MKPKNISEQYRIILILILVVILGSILVYLCLNPKVLIRSTLSSLIGLGNLILVSLTLLVLYQYAADTNLMANETKRMTELQNELQFYPSVSIELTSYYELIENLGKYSVVLTYKNNSKYPVTITQYWTFYWFNYEFKEPESLEDIQLKADPIFQIPPNTSIQFYCLIDEKRTEKVLRDLGESCSPKIWVNHVRSPYYLVIKYKAENEYLSADFTKLPLFYNIMFRFREKKQIIAETFNKYINIFEHMTSERTKSEIISSIIYANNEAKDPKWDF